METGMDCLHNLIEITTRAHNDGDLPEEILAEVQTLVAHAAGLTGKASLIHTLITTIEEYDPYAGVGCFGGGTTLDDIRRALQAIKA